MMSRTETPFFTPLCLQKMLDYLKDKKDVGFFLSVQSLMQTCRSEDSQTLCLLKNA